MFLLVNVWSYFLTFVISVGPNDVIPLAVSKVRPPRKLIYPFVLSLEVLPSEFVAFHLLEMHDGPINKYQFTMMTTNLLPIYIVFCRNL